MDLGNFWVLVALEESFSILVELLDMMALYVELLGLPASWLVIVFTAFRLVHTGTGKSGSCLAEITHFLSEVETSVNTSSSPEVETSVITYSSSLSNLIKAWSNETHCDTTTSVRNTVQDTLERDDDETLSINQYVWCDESGG